MGRQSLPIDLSQFGEEQVFESALKLRRMLLNDKLRRESRIFGNLEVQFLLLAGNKVTAHHSVVFSLHGLDGETLRCLVRIPELQRESLIFELSPSRHTNQYNISPDASRSSRATPAVNCRGCAHLLIRR